MKKSVTKIKVIRKKDRNQVKEKKASPVPTGEKSARKIVANVSTWVADLQRRKRAETKEAIDKLFPAKPQTDSA